MPKEAGLTRQVPPQRHDVEGGKPNFTCPKLLACLITTVDNFDMDYLSMGKGTYQGVSSQGELWNLRQYYTQLMDRQGKNWLGTAKKVRKRAIVRRD